ncbi:hypothetical protein E2R55_06065 [Vibrio vulnificus]|nr:hypothetical protein E2R55_06065 [Vibrio vulnificus]
MNNQGIHRRKQENMRATSWNGCIAAVTTETCVKSQQTGEKEPIELAESKTFIKNEKEWLKKSEDYKITNLTLWQN